MKYFTFSTDSGDDDDINSQSETRRKTDNAALLRRVCPSTNCKAQIHSIVKGEKEDTLLKSYEIDSFPTVQNLVVDLTVNCIPPSLHQVD